MREREQHRHGIKRVDDEHARPLLRRRRERPQQLRAINRKRIQQRVGDEAGSAGKKQPPRAVWRVRVALLHRPGDEGGECGQHEYAVAETAVIGHGRNRIGVTDENVQIGQRAEQRAINQRLAPLLPPHADALHRRAQHRLCE